MRIFNLILTDPEPRYNHLSHRTRVLQDHLILQSDRFLNLVVRLPDSFDLLVLDQLQDQPMFARLYKPGEELRPLDL